MPELQRIPHDLGAMYVPTDMPIPVLDDRYKQVQILSAATETERHIIDWRRDNTWFHLRPNSVLVTAMGNHWAPGSWSKVADMVMYTNRQGLCAWLFEIQDRCFEPLDAMGTMRNEALMEAVGMGFEYVMYIDNDVLPEPDALVKLLLRDMAIIAPYVVEAGTGKKLHGPERQPNTGLQPIRWCVLSMLLFKTAVFRGTGSTFWADPMGADEGFHFKRLWHFFGHRPYLDTTIQLQVSKRPTYPLSSNRMLRDQNAVVALDQRMQEAFADLLKARNIAWPDWQQFIRDLVGYDERQRYWREKQIKLTAPPDRRPARLDSRWVTPSNEYFPFGAPDWQPDGGPIQPAPLDMGHGQTPRQGGAPGLPAESLVDILEKRLEVARGL